MTAPYDPAECARLIAQARERSTLITADIPECTCAGWPHHSTCLQEGHLEKLAWLRNTLRALADQLEAAQVDNDSLRTAMEVSQRAADRRGDKLLAERDALRSANENSAGVIASLRERCEQLTTERDSMRPVVEAAEELVDNWRDDDAEEIGSGRIEEAVDAYRAARDKAVE